MFAYDVMSEQEAMQERFQLLKEGVYDAVIEKSIDTISANSGNNMMDMTLAVYNENGKAHAIRDFLVFTKGTMWKVVHCADSAGVTKEYDEQKFCSELMIGKRVKVKIGIEKGNIIPIDKLKDNQYGAKYPDKNKVEDYVSMKDQNSVTSSSGTDIPDDDVPF